MVDWLSQAKSTTIGALLLVLRAVALIPPHRSSLRCVGAAAPYFSAVDCANTVLIRRRPE